MAALHQRPRPAKGGAGRGSCVGHEDGKAEELGAEPESADVDGVRSSPCSSANKEYSPRPPSSPRESQAQPGRRDQKVHPGPFTGALISLIKLN